MFYILLCSTAVATLRQGIALIFNRVLSAEDLPTKKLYGGTSSWASSFRSVAGEVSHSISASKWVCILRTAFRAAFLQEHLSWLHGTKILNIVTWGLICEAERLIWYVHEFLVWVLILQPSRNFWSRNWSCSTSKKWTSFWSREAWCSAFWGPYFTCWWWTGMSMSSCAFYPTLVEVKSFLGMSIVSLLAFFLYF